jgi:hypothetical protein
MEQTPYSYQEPAGPENSGLAIGSLVASILGLTFVPFVGSIAGLIMGYMAKRQIEESAGTLGGEGLAKAGIIIGWVGIGLTVVGVCIWLFVVLGFGGLGFCAALGNTAY